MAPEQPKALLNALRALTNDETARERFGAAARAWAVNTLSRSAARDAYDLRVTTVLSGNGRRAKQAKTPVEVTR